MPGLPGRRPIAGPRHSGSQDALPVVGPQAGAAGGRPRRASWSSDAGGVLIVRRGPGGLWEGFWEFPTVHLAGPDPAGRSFGEPVDLAEGVRRLTGRLGRGRPAGARPSSSA